jgi:LysM repeat protein
MSSAEIFCKITNLRSIHFRGENVMGTKPIDGTLATPLLSTKVEYARQSSKQSYGKNFADVLKTKQHVTTAGQEASGTVPVEYIVKKGDNLSKIAKHFDAVNPRQIVRDNALANPDKIFPGQKIMIYQSHAKAAQPKAATVASEQPKAATLTSEQTKAAAPVTEQTKARVDMTASWYGAEHHNKLTASGQRFDMHKNTLAHKSLPFGTKVKLFNPENGNVAEGIVNDRGPFAKGRDLDVSYSLAKMLGFEKKGVTRLSVEIVAPPESKTG